MKLFGQSGIQMELGRLGIGCSVESLSAAEAIGMARKFEAMGYGTMWFGELVAGRDPFVMASLLLANTARIRIGLCVANVWKREAAAMINAARTLAGLYEDRFVLAVGVSHQKFVDLYGLDRKSTRLNSSHVSISYAVFC